MKVDDINKTLVRESELDDEDFEQPKPSKTKMIVLILGCLLMFGNNYSFDNP